jgi:hypothetical protein
MWLINTRTLRLENVGGPADASYAILSHTWTSEELSFQDWELLEASGEAHFALTSKIGYQKIVKTCRLARDGDLPYAWIDTICINKTSSAELSEAINSMFEWYKWSTVCFVYLEDLDATAGIDTMGGCRWFTRGWTLQELIAPGIVQFFDQTWTRRASKLDHRDLLSDITGIDLDVLTDSKLLELVPVARRMSWAADRKTTRREDAAYSMLGIFNVNIPLLYGEGSKSFIRLQEEILRTTAELSLFAWEWGRSVMSWREDNSGLLATSPQQFKSCSHLKTPNFLSHEKPEVQLTNLGIQLDATFVQNLTESCLLDLNCCRDDGSEVKWLFVKLQKRGRSFIRSDPRGISWTESRLALLGVKRKVYLQGIVSSTEAAVNDLLPLSTAVIRLSNDARERAFLHAGLPSRSWKSALECFRFESGSFWTGIVPFKFRWTSKQVPERLALICTNGLSLRQINSHSSRGIAFGALLSESDPDTQCKNIVRLAHGNEHALSETVRLAEIKDLIFAKFADNYGLLARLRRRMGIIASDGSGTSETLSVSVRDSTFLLEYHRDPSGQLPGAQAVNSTEPTQLAVR